MKGSLIIGSSVYAGDDYPRSTRVGADLGMV